MEGVEDGQAERWKAIGTVKAEAATRGLPGTNGERSRREERQGKEVEEVVDRTKESILMTIKRGGNVERQTKAGVTGWHTFKFS